MSAAVDKSLAKLFGPTSYTTLLRRLLWHILGTANLVTATVLLWDQAFYLRYSLVVWIAFRLFSLGSILWFADDVAREKARRVDALPMHWRHWLLTGKSRVFLSERESRRAS